MASRKLQLNAPAGDWASLKAAVNNGADAVYFGLKLFNARRLADNFSEEDLKDIVGYCHLHNVKVLLALNTLVRNDELNNWFLTLEKAFVVGIDGVIIQELFLVPLIKEYFPVLAVHASTQASLMNSQGINAFKEIDTVVLARELSEKEIKIIRSRVKASLEIFVHGHLCVSCSGQCLISSFIGKRSGNRGTCASSCRKLYQDDKGRRGFLLSPKDLMLADRMDAILAAGIDTVKIEGRMKSPEYVGITTRIYRKMIDASLAGKHVLITKEDINNLRMGFNRDFTHGFFSEENIIDPSMPTNRGISLGTVRDGSLLLEHDLNVLDGVGFWRQGSRGRMEGLILKALSVMGRNVDHARKGQAVVINSRHFMNGAQVFLTSQNKGLEPSGLPKLVTFDIAVSGKEEKKLRLSCSGSSYSFQAESLIALQEAKTYTLTKELLSKELEKSISHRGIKWNISEFNVPEGLFLPSSMLSVLRKELENSVFSAMTPERKSCLSELPSIKEQTSDCEPRLLVKVHSLEQLKEANESGVYAIYYDLFSPDALAAKEACTKTRFFLDTPVIMTDKDVEEGERIISLIKPDGITVSNWGMLRAGFKGEKHGTYALNVFNDISAEGLRDIGVLPLVSTELNASQAIAFRNKEIIYYAHGRIPVMHLRGLRAERRITDEKGYTFPLRAVHGNTEMLYSRPIAMFEGVKKLADAGVRYFFLDLERDTTTIIKTYQGILAGRKPDTSMLKRGTTLGNYEKVVG